MVYQITRACKCHSPLKAIVQLACTMGQLENTESGNGIREQKRKRTISAHAHDLNEWAGQPINGRIEICSIKFVCFMHTVLTKETSRTDQQEQ